MGMDGLPPPAPRRARCPWACLRAGAKLRRPRFCHGALPGAVRLCVDRLVVSSWELAVPHSAAMR